MHPEEVARLIQHGTAQDLAPGRRHEVSYSRDVDPGCYQQQLKPNPYLQQVINSGQTRVTAAERELIIRSFRSNPWAAARNSPAARFEDPQHKRHPVQHPAPYPWVENSRDGSPPAASVTWPAHASRSAGHEMRAEEVAEREANMTLHAHRS